MVAYLFKHQQMKITIIASMLIDFSWDLNFFETLGGDDHRFCQDGIRPQLSQSVSLRVDKHLIMDKRIGI